MKKGRGEQTHISGCSYAGCHPHAGAYELLHVLTGKADHYHAWATEYYEMPLDRSLVQRMFEMEPLDEDKLKGLNDELELADLEEDIREIGYPVKG